MSFGAQMMNPRLIILGISLAFACGAPATWAQAVPPSDATAQAAAGEKMPDAPMKAIQRIPDTLMFTTDELTEIQSRAPTSGGQGGDNPDSRDRSSEIENASLYLSTIVYYGPSDWTIWVNGVPVTQTQDFPDFRVTSIGPNFVELLVPLSARGMSPVRLSPNQSFITKSGTIVEGPWQ
ncbi:MAG: hypothetical protein K2P94_14370 [Rhodospirillaceae bacterium]|nr:hypothetical protein [Rhodospirillaceae bacterium]